MKNFLRVTMLAICTIFMVANVSAQGTYDQATMGAKVVEMETASWGQNKPYNDLCPTVGTTPTKTGCGPTAFAILCHYYKWPVSGSGSVTHNGETLDLSTHTYDYENMLLSYSGSYNDDQATAVATLMRDLGYATKVGYGTSATTFSENIKALKANFSFTNSIFNPTGTGMDVLYRSDVGDESFKRQLKECLSQGYPILFTSLVDDNNPNTTDGRHIFILDGYTENEFFHFNFGWNGYGNGWYTLDNVRPDEESDYSTQQRAYLYVIPNRTPRAVTASVSPAGAGAVTVNGNANSAEVIENTYATLVATANSGYTFSHWSKGGAQVSTEKTYKALVAAAGNEYVANFLTVGNNRVNVSVSYNSSYGTVTYNSSAVSGTGITPYQNSEVTLVATPLDGYVFNGWTVKKGTNTTNYAGTELTFVATEDMSVEANFSTAIATYYISEATGTLENSTSSRYTTWSSSEVSGLYLTASYNSNAVEAISFNSDQVKLISAIYEDKTSTYKSPVTYTLSAPNGYVITAYSMTYKSSSSNYNMTVANAQMTQTLANRNEVLTLSATGLSAQNTSFTVSGANTNYAIQVQEFTVTLQKEGAEGGGSTPTPDPEPEPDPTPTTYAVKTTANPAAGGTAKFAVGTGSQKTQGDVENGTEITLYAVANTGYNFVNWTLGGNVVSTDATCNVSVAQASSYVANFEAEAAEPELPITGTEVNATFAGATGFVNQGKTNQVVLPATQTAPAITFSANDAKIGYSTVDGIKYPYLFKGTDFTISVPAPYKIAGYKLTVQGHNFNEGTFTYTVGTQNAAAAMRTAASARSNAATATISGTTPLSVMATGLNTSEINIGVGSATAETAGIIVKELQLDLVQEAQEPVEVSGNLEFTFTRNGSDVDVTVSGADGVTATIAATSPDATNTTTTTGIWNTGGEMADGTEVLCTSTNTSNATEDEPITYTLTVQGLKANITKAVFTNIAVNKDGGLQSVNSSIRQCNFKLEANSSVVSTLSDQNIWVTSGTENTIEFNDFSVAADGTLTIKLTLYKGTDNLGCYYGLKKITLTAAEPDTDPLAGKYFRLRVKNTTNYMNIANNTEHPGGTTGGVNVTTKNESNDGQIFQFIESGTGYKLLSKTGYYIKCQPWNVDAISVGTVLSFETAGADNEYFIKWDNTNMDNGKERDDYFKVENGYVYCDAAQSAAATWVLEEVVYYTVTATAGEGGSVSPLTTTIEQGKPVTLTATANEGYRFVNWTLSGNVVSTDASYTFNATAAGEYVANFEISTYTISATANPGTAGSVTINGEAVSSKNVNENSTVTLVATPQAGYCFVNWTKDGVEVSTDATYSFTATEITSLVANFEQIVANVTLTDIQDNTYNVTLNGLTGEVNAETLAAKLKAEYPFIEEFGINPTFADNGTSYTYTNTVKLKFKVSNPASDETDNLWHNIYYPTNTNGRPNYLSASTTETTLVEKVNDETYNYGANPTYNTMGGNPNIAWAIYNVNNSFEFIFKNELTGKYIKVESIASNDAQNVQFVEKAEATAFTFLGDAGTYNGDYALVAKIGEETGYLCSSSSSYGYATHHYSNTQQGAWMKIQEADYTDFIRALDERLLRFDIGNDKYLITDEFQIMIDSLVYNKEQIRLNQFNTYFDAIDKAVKTWPKISLTITPENKGTTNIGGEENVVRKYVPTGDLTIEAVPVEGYHFVKWIDGTNEVETAAYTKNISGGKDDVIALTAEFAINIYNINVTAGEGGNASASAATAEHGSEVTLTAVANDGYEFAGWYDGENLISAEASYTFTVTSHINYTARFNEVSTGTVAIHITVASTDGTTVTNAVDGNVKAIIDGIGQEWATDADFVADANVALSATSDHNDMAYLFDGWYKNGVLVSTEKDIVVKATETATYEARFFRGCVVIGNSNNIRYGRVMGITLADGTTIGYDAANRAVVKAGTTVKINTINIMYGYEVGSWIDANDEVVGSDNSLIVEVNNDVTYTAIFEPASYNLTVRANNDSYGTVSATSGTSTGTNIKVGHNMGATITATAKTGYYFVNWTKGTDVVSESATYTIPGIAEVKDMLDVEYIANFRPVENATAGTYYRIAYDFPAPAAAGAARTGATRAVGTDGTVEYVISQKTGTQDGDPGSVWEYTTINSNQPQITMTATSPSGISVKKIDAMNDGIRHSLIANVSTTELSVIYTIAVSGDFKITGYSIDVEAYGNLNVIHNGNSLAISSGIATTLSGNGLDTSSFVIEVGTSRSNQNAALDINSFIVYIKEVGNPTPEPEPEPEPTPANRYYMQSVACGVSGENNLPDALLMTQDTLAASIFYYADSKLLSYDKGTYIKEDGGTRGLQAVGASGTVTITTTGETSTIAAPSYMHANSKGTTYYVDHCGRDNGDVQHNFVLKEVTTLPVTITDALHATFYAPVAVKIPDGVKAYVLKAEDIPGIKTYAWMTSLKNGIIPANTGVILKSKEDKTYYFDITENTDEARAEAVGNVLSGTVAKTKITHDAYILANRDGRIGLYPVAKNSYLNGSNDGVRFTNNSHKAYLPVTDDWFGEQLKQGTGFRFVYDDEETTGIDEFETELEDTIYDLQGRKLSEITEPGIYIVNGKKIFVK